MLAEPHIVVHPLDEEDVARGEDRMVPGTAVSKTTGARLEVEGAIDNILTQRKGMVGKEIGTQLEKAALGPDTPFPCRSHHDFAQN